VEQISLVTDAKTIKAFNKAMDLLDKNKHEKALIILKKVVKDLNVKEVWLNMGVAYKGLNNLKKVRECFEKACDENMPLSNGKTPKIWPIAFSNLGLLYYALEEDELASQLHRLALTEDPSYYDAIWNLSLSELRQYCSNKSVDVNKAWEYYSWRFKRKNAAPLKNTKKDLIFWDFKTPYLNDSIVILSEQGMGDSIMFGRYLEIVKSKFKKVYVQCSAELDCLFEHTCRDPIETDAMFAVPMTSLAKVCSDIPAGDWLRNKYVPKVGGDVNIMCVWGGSKSHTNNLNRSTYPGYFDRFRKYGKLHSLEPRKGYELLEVKDWEATIKYLEEIDIVIAVDTSIVHLCGSLGKPCIMLMPLYDTDFRWGDSSMGTSNIWYSSVKVIRNENNWEKTFNAAEHELSTWLQLSNTRKSE
jgi:tetratricopeptide (TPR) repeat protein